MVDLSEVLAATVSERIRAVLLSNRQ